MSIINLGRAHVGRSFGRVVEAHCGRDCVTELALRDAWLEEIHSASALTTNGWYDPPETGAVILSCSSDDVRRSHFKSFRDPSFFSSDAYIDWSDGILIAYASNVDRASGVPADFATTVYFGEDARVRQYLRKCFAACRVTLDGLQHDWSAGRTYDHIETAMREHGLDGKTWSNTDNGYNYGHTLPSLIRIHPRGDIDLGRELASEHATEMRQSRKFVSANADWALADGEQFTIEPQCVSPEDASMPKAMIHYVARVDGSAIEICDSCDELPRQFGLI